MSIEEDRALGLPVRREPIGAGTPCAARAPSKTDALTPEQGLALLWRRRPISPFVLNAAAEIIGGRGAAAEIFSYAESEVLGQTMLEHDSDEPRRLLYGLRAEALVALGSCLQNSQTPTPPCPCRPTIHSFPRHPGVSMDSTETLNDVSMVAKACRMREMAQDRIVRAFRLQIEGKGSGPAEEELQCFARLVSVEEALRKSYLVETPNPAAFSASADVQATGTVSAGQAAL